MLVNGNGEGAAGERVSDVDFGDRQALASDSSTSLQGRHMVVSRSGVRH